MLMAIVYGHCLWSLSIVIAYGHCRWSLAWLWSLPRVIIGGHCRWSLYVCIFLQSIFWFSKVENSKKNFEFWKTLKRHLKNIIKKLYTKSHNPTMKGSCSKEAYEMPPGVFFQSIFRFSKVEISKKKLEFRKTLKDAT